MALSPDRLKHWRAKTIACGDAATMASKAATSCIASRLTTDEERDLRREIGLWVQAAGDAAQDHEDRAVAAVVASATAREAQRQAAERTRFTMDMSPETSTAMERVRVAIGVQSKADVVREAVALLMTLVEVAEDQKDLWIGDGESMQRLLHPPLRHAARLAKGAR